MSIAVCCCHCRAPLPAWPVDKCPECGKDPHTEPAEGDTADWEVPAELQDGWEDPDVVEE